MRFRITEEDPSFREEICEIVRDGVSPGHERRRNKSRLLERLQKSCYLGENFQRNSARDRLLAQYLKDGLVLFLGAGVSAGSGIPGWKKLAADVFKKQELKSEIKTDYETIKWAFPDLETQFDLVGHKLGPEEFANVLWHALYDGLKCKSEVAKISKERKRQLNCPGWSGLREKLCKDNQTLAAVGELLIERDGNCVEKDRKWQRNSLIHAVLTTNTDNLLELYCQAITSGKN